MSTKLNRKKVFKTWISDLAQQVFPEPKKVKCLQCQKEWKKFKSELLRKSQPKNQKEKITKNHTAQYTFLKK